MLPEVWSRKGSLTGPAFDDLLNRFFYGFPVEKIDEVVWSPRTDIQETEKEVIVDIELPGMKREDIKVEVKNGMLTIFGESKQEKKFEKGETTRVERRYGKFERSFSLSDTINENKISAEYKDGILSLAMQKTEKALPKEIKVEVK
ncbi:MAG: Hsp20/alpha crystallin family protein [Candidatus Latescibacterota bacterium]